MSRLGRLKGLAAGLGVPGAVDFAQFGDDGFAVLPRHKIQRIADEMDAAAAVVKT